MGPEMWWPFVCGWLQRHQQGTVPCILPRLGKLLRLPLPDFYESYVFFSEVKHGRAELGFFLDRLRPGSVLYDIGGFRGVFTVASKLKLNGDITVHVFEPLDINARAIARICELNQLTGVEIIPLAVGDGTPMAGKVNTATGVAMLRLGDVEASETQNIKSVSLDDYISQGAPPPSVIKIDVDGHELQLLNGAKNCLNKHHPDLWLEVHPIFLKAQGKTHEEVLNLLRNMGYAVSFFEDYHWPSWEGSFHVWCTACAK
jgi:FkbM family methyltransferase